MNLRRTRTKAMNIEKEQKGGTGKGYRGEERTEGTEGRKLLVKLTTANVRHIENNFLPQVANSL